MNRLPRHVLRNGDRLGRLARFQCLSARHAAELGMVLREEAIDRPRALFEVGEKCGGRLERPSIFSKLPGRVPIVARTAAQRQYPELIPPSADYPTARAEPFGDSVCAERAFSDLGDPNLSAR